MPKRSVSTAKEVKTAQLGRVMAELKSVRERLRQVEAAYKAVVASLPPEEQGKWSLEPAKRSFFYER